MKKQLRIGSSDYRGFIEEDGYFIDKTLFIKEVIDNAHQVMLIPRPRRFGKTLNLSMLRYFFDASLKDTAALFEPYKIWQEEEYYTAQQGKYPVIYLSLKGAKATGFERSQTDIYGILTEVYQEHRYLLEKDILEKNEVELFENILSNKADASIYESSLKKLCEYLHRYYGEKTIVLMDEYDAPIHTGFYHDYYGEIIQLMKSLMGNTFKDNPYLQKGVITGILRIAKESIFSDFNNPGIFTILNYGFADKFGFTEEEVQTLLQDFGLSDHFPAVKEWYDGYKFGDKEHIYNPWSVINYVDKHREGFKSWWMNTSSDELIKSRISAKNATVIRTDINDLLEGKAITKMIDENIVFSDFHRKKDLIWSLLVFSGYLNSVETISLKRHSLAIPNREIKFLFREMVLEWLDTEVNVSFSTLLAMTESLTNNNIPEFERHFKTVMQDTFSYFDIHTEPERVYQAYVLGLLGMLGDDYIIKSNRESGSGRYDILLLPKQKEKYGIVIEIKQLEKGAAQQQIDETLSNALLQISKHQYYQELLSHDVGKRIEMAMVFVGKEVFLQVKHDSP